MYIIVVKAGILGTKYSRNHYQQCTHPCMNYCTEYLYYQISKPNFGQIVIRYVQFIVIASDRKPNIYQVGLYSQEND